MLHCKLNTSFAIWKKSQHKAISSLQCFFSECERLDMKIHEMFRFSYVLATTCTNIWHVIIWSQTSRLDFDERWIDSENEEPIALLD